MACEEENLEEQKTKKIEIIEDVHIKHYPKQKEKQINKKSKKTRKKNIEAKKTPNNKKQNFNRLNKK